MKQYAPVIVVVLACITALLSLFGDSSISKIRELEQAIEVQRDTNAELREKVVKLRHETTGLRHDDRALERAARNELGMARPNETIFIFEKEGKGSSN